MRHDVLAGLHKMKFGEYFFGRASPMVSRSAHRAKMEFSKFASFFHLFRCEGLGKFLSFKFVRDAL